MFDNDVFGQLLLEQGLRSMSTLPIGEFSRLWILDVSQHAHLCDGPCTHRCLDLEIAGVGRHSHDLLIVQPVDVICHLWIHDVKG